MEVMVYMMWGCDMGGGDSINLSVIWNIDVLGVRSEG